MNTNTTTSQPLDLEAAFRAQRTAARNALPAMLALLPLAVVTAACEWCARFVNVLAKGADTASAMHDAADREIAPDVRAVADVILAAVLGHTSIDALNDGPGDGAWETLYLVDALTVIKLAQESVTGLARGERDRPGAIGPHDPDALTASDVRRRAYDGQRRAVVRAVVSSIPQGERAEVLAHVIAWESVLGGLARTVANTDNPAVMRACHAAAWETVQAFERVTAPHSYAMNALSALWHNVTPCYALRALGAEDPRELRELVDECDAAAEDLAHVRGLLSPVAA